MHWTDKIYNAYSSLNFFISKGYKPKDTIKIFIGTRAWQEAKEALEDYPVSTLVLPPWDCPKLYKWPVMQCSVIIKDTAGAEKDYLRDLAICLYRGGAETVSAIKLDQSITIYQRELKL